MQKILRYILTLAFVAGVGFWGYAQDAPKKKVAVYITGKDVNESHKKVIGSKLVSAITESGKYAAVERTADFLAALAAENDYQTSGEVRDSQIAALGQKFGVKFVAVADVSEVFDEYFVAARLINVETGMVERAYDTNSPTESMNQLVDLSKNVATGLFAGITSSTSSQHAPIHLSLCAIDNRNGQVQYFNAEQWQTMSEGAKLNYKKQGVVIAENGEAFLVAIRDAGMKDWNSAMSSCKLPAKWQLQLMYKYYEQLNTALQIFGGEPLSSNNYWTNESDGSSTAWYGYMASGTIHHNLKTNPTRVRPVAPVGVSEVPSVK